MTDEVTDSEIEAREIKDGEVNDGEVAVERLNQRAYVAAVVAFVIAVFGGLLAAWSYWTDRTAHGLGLGLALALGGIGFGLVSWSKYLDLPENIVQERHRLRTTEEERADFEEVVVETGETVGRRKLLVALFAGSFGSLIIGFVGPIGSLGPKPSGQLERTGWTAGRRLVTSDGAPISVDEGRFDQLSTIFPEGEIGRDDSQVILLRVHPDVLTEKTVEGGAVEGWVAYSKICTHAGCSVGLFGVDNRPPDVLRQLVCPCHQSVFDPVDAAKPVGGPAPRSLPQLPIAVDDEGFLVAQSDFDRPVGPIPWNDG
jgi:ubiquinol-cytochrome c reductase iron-sulfur subunit